VGAGRQEAGSPGAVLMERNEHKFDFSGSKIARAASMEAEYHRERLAHWHERHEVAKEKVEGTIGAKLAEHEVTGGTQLNVVVDYGDKEAWEELQLAHQKIKVRREAAERYDSDATVYGTQAGRNYQLDADDVQHFRLGGPQNRPA
jgi:hypothetical protein